MKTSPLFLSVDNIIQIHERMFEEFGGMPGVADQGLLESAAAMPGAGVSGEYLHKTIPAMAAAYLFHLSRNHPFFDGNKRVAIAAAEVFLDLNGMYLDVSNDDLKDFCLKVAASELSKDEVTAFFEAHSKPLVV